MQPRNRCPLSHTLRSPTIGGEEITEVVIIWEEIGWCTPGNFKMATILPWTSVNHKEKNSFNTLFSPTLIHSLKLTIPLLKKKEAISKGYSWVLVSTHLKNRFVNIEIIFPKLRNEMLGEGSTPTKFGDGHPTFNKGDIWWSKGWPQMIIEDSSK